MRTRRQASLNTQFNTTQPLSSSNDIVLKDPSTTTTTDQVRRSIPLKRVHDQEEGVLLEEELDFDTDTFSSQPEKEVSERGSQRNELGLKKKLKQASSFMSESNALTSKESFVSTDPMSTTTMNLYLLPKPFKKTDFQGPSKKIRSVKQILSGLATSPPGIPTWTSIQAAPSIRPLPKYCDITGLPSNYTDPATGLHFYNKEVYQHIKALSSSHVQRYLAIRNKAVVI